MLPITTKLVKLSICPCGYVLLHDDIKIGTEYTVYPEAPPGPLPLELFEIGNEWPEIIE